MKKLFFMKCVRSVIVIAVMMFFSPAHAAVTFQASSICYNVDGIPFLEPLKSTCCTNGIITNTVLNECVLGVVTFNKQIIDGFSEHHQMLLGVETMISELSGGALVFSTPTPTPSPSPLPTP